MDKNAAKAASSIVLSKDLLGTDALTIPKLFNVDGWRCIVTGGGTGLGLVTAAALAQNGATVYITGRRLNVLEEAAKSARPASGKGKLVPIQADVSTKEGVRALRDEVKKHEKWINLLVNNHGVSLGAPKIDECEQTAEAISEQMFENEDISKWDETYRINTTSYYFTTFAFLPLLAAAKTQGGAAEPGNVVNISSISGLTPTSQRGQFNYNASKAATLLLSKMLSTEFARRGLGVRVNCICPGYFPTGMSVFPDMTEEESRKFFRERFAIPFARTGNAVDYAQTIIGVVTNQYMTGAEILIDGGWMAECAF